MAEKPTVLPNQPDHGKDHITVIDDLDTSTTYRRMNGTTQGIRFRFQETPGPDDALVTIVKVSDSEGDGLTSKVHLSDMGFYPYDGGFYNANNWIKEA